MGSNDAPARSRARRLSAKRPCFPTLDHASGRGHRRSQEPRKGVLSRERDHPLRLGGLNELTGASSRRSAFAPLDAAHRVCVALIDLDHFKSINDTLGHEASDGALEHAGSSAAHPCACDVETARACANHADVFAGSAQAHAGVSRDELIPRADRALDAAKWLIRSRVNIDRTRG
ncbi:hypothetical protein BURKHO8Y_70186 [Burkholderia sp. 8Y]|nr:hypothetical protein BURKHO8Y_70186 [Burkholderia sp. 8Y]